MNIEELLVLSHEARIDRAVAGAAGAGAHSNALCGWYGTFGNATCRAVQELVGGVRPCDSDPRGTDFWDTIQEVLQSAYRQYGNRPGVMNSYCRGQFGLD